MRADSRAVHAGRELGPRDPQAPTLVPTSAWVFTDLDDYDSVASAATPGHVYARESSTNVSMLEVAMAALEGAESSAATASGMAAVLTSILALAPRPAPLVVDRRAYGGSLALLRRDLAPLGYVIREVDLDDARALEVGLDGAALLLAETISNPLCRVCDLDRVALACRRAGAALVVDGTFATPILNRPLEHGATLVLHSATKYLGGHSDLVAGVVCGPEAIIEEVRARRSRLGASLGAFEAWLALRGLRTLHLRMPRHSSNGLRLARAMKPFPGVERVHHPALDVEAGAVCQRLLPAGSGGMFAFDLDGGRPAVQRLVSGLGLVRFAASLGGVETTISYPALTSHRSLSAEERRAAGVGEGTVRVSTGLEDPQDLIDDFQQALGTQ